MINKLKLRPSFFFKQRLSETCLDSKALKDVYSVDKVFSVM